MKEISLQELHQDTAEWVRLAARRETIIITDDGEPIATLKLLEPSRSVKRLPDREGRIESRSAIKVDSVDYISEMRG
ncbi:MAG: type II toxin-antitoxin system Phd/YefM family antitoxin [Blastocatellia bacterium]